LSTSENGVFQQNRPGAAVDLVTPKQPLIDTVIDQAAAIIDTRPVYRGCNSRSCGGMYRSVVGRTIQPPAGTACQWLRDCDFADHRTCEACSWASVIVASGRWLAAGARSGAAGIGAQRIARGRWRAHLDTAITTVASVQRSHPDLQASSVND
jgi:hypothetical protein